MGKSSKPTIGFWHKLTLYLGWGWGPMDALHALEWGGEMAWEGEQTESGDIVIDKPDLFGGEKKEGGIRGTLSVRMGEATQVPHPLLQALVPGPWPAARDLVTTVYDGDVGALTPYVKNLRALWSRYLKGWDRPVWQPSLAKVGDGMNAAHIIYQLLTHRGWGYGAAPADILVEDNLLAVAQTLHDESLGLCLTWRTSEAVGTMLSRVCQHIGGEWGILDDKVIVTLYRGNYDVETLPLLDESNIVDLQSWEEPQPDGSVNEVTVVGVDATTGKDISRTYQNLANVQAQGRVIAEKKQLPGLHNYDLVGRAARRECEAVSMLPQRIKVAVKASAGPFYRGQVLAISWAKRGVVRMPVRVAEIDEGTATDTKVQLTLLQAVDGMAQTSYLVDTGTVWAPPDHTPVPLDPEAVYEATYRDLAGIMRPADLAMVEPEAGYLVAVGARPAGPAYNYDLITRTGAVPFADVGSGDFTPHGQLAVGIGPTTTAIALSDHRNLELVNVGEEVVIGTEHCRVDAIDPQTGQLTIARGCVDTVPRSHLAGVRAWFPDTYQGFDPTEYVDGETVDAKLLTRTKIGVLAVGAATTRSVTMAGRQFRPYPPGRLRINGQVYPAAVTALSLTADVAERDRLLQADQLVDTEQGSIGPEPDTTKTFRWYLDDILVRTEAGVSGPSDTYTPSGDGTVRVEVESVRDGIESWQALSHQFDFVAGVPVAYLGATITPPVNGGTIDVQMPAVVDAGDLLIIQYLNRSNSTPGTPGGWSATHTAARTTSLRQTWFTKVADGSEAGTTVNIGSSGTFGRGAICHRIAAGAFGSFGASSANDNTDAPDAPSRSSGFGAVPTLWIVGCSIRNALEASAFPYPDDNITNVSSGIANSLALASCTVQNSLASIDPSAFTLPSAENWVATTFSIEIP